MFSGFYVGQTALLLYLCATFLVAPFLLTGYTVSAGTAFFAGSLIILTTFLPVLAYFAKDPVRQGSAGAVVMCGLVYGTTDFSTARGVLGSTGIGFRMPVVQPLVLRLDLGWRFHHGNADLYGLPDGSQRPRFVDFFFGFNY